MRFHETVRIPYANDEDATVAITVDFTDHEPVDPVRPDESPREGRRVTNRSYYDLC